MLFMQPRGDLVVGNHLSMTPIGDRCSIRNMIGVTMTDQDMSGRYISRFTRSRWVVIEKWIEQ
jgi:hypothetical protein